MTRSIRPFIAALVPLFVGSVASCAAGNPTTLRDAGGADAQRPPLDAGVDGGSEQDDAGSTEDAGAMEDVGTELDAGVDAGPPPPPDGGPSDAGSVRMDAGPSCGAISTGDTLALDGTGDLAQFPASQVITPGAPIGASDTFALTWDADYLYLVLVSPVFDGEFKPLHVYVEARAALATPTRTTGKEYSGEVPVLEFAATHVIAVRSRTDSGGGSGPYNGVYTASSAWVTRDTPLDLGTDYWVSGDGRTIAVRVPWSSLGCPSALRLTAHVVNAEPVNEWKDLVPETATPWGAEGTGSGGGFYEIDLSGDPAISGWTLRP